MVAPRSLAAFALLCCSSTLMCCALPAALVMVGAGSVMATLLSWFPAIAVLSQHKALVFAIAGGSLLIAGQSLRLSRRRPCPVDPMQARRCRRRLEHGRLIYAVSCSAFVVGTFFAHILPILSR